MTDQPHSIPEKLEFIAESDCLIIRRSWFGFQAYFLLFFVVFWDTFLAFWYAMALSHKHGHQWFVLLFPLIHVGVGLGLTYFVIASFINKTDVIISPNLISVRTHPLPCFGNKDVSPLDIASVLVRERIGSKGARSYHVMYVDRSNKEQRLVRLNQLDQAQFISDQLNDSLGLKKA